MFVAENKHHFNTVILALELPGMIHLQLGLWEILKPDT